MFRLNRAPLTWVLLAVFSLGSAAAAQAQEQLFGVAGSGLGGPPGPPVPLSTLYELSPTTGAVISTGPGGSIGAIGAIGFPHVVAIDFHPTTGMLYGIANSVPPFIAGGSTLITINPVTGIGTFVAPITGLTFCAFGDNLNDMSFDSGGTLFVWRQCSAELYTVDITFGVATPIGIPVIPFPFQNGLAFDSSDTLYLKTESVLWTISSATGMVLSGPVAFGAFGATNNVLAFDMADLLYTAVRGGSSPLMTLGTPPPPCHHPPFRHAVRPNPARNGDCGALGSRLRDPQ